MHLKSLRSMISNELNNYFKFASNNRRGHFVSNFLSLDVI